MVLALRIIVVSLDVLEYTIFVSILTIVIVVRALSFGFTFKQWAVVLNVVCCPCLVTRWCESEKGGALWACLLQSWGLLGSCSPSFRLLIAPKCTQIVLIKRADHDTCGNLKRDGWCGHVVFDFVWQVLAVTLLLRVDTADIVVKLMVFLLISDWGFCFDFLGYLVDVAWAHWAF